MDGDLENLFGIDELFEESSQIKTLTRDIKENMKKPSDKKKNRSEIIKDMHPDVKHDIESLIKHLKSNYSDHIEKIHTIDGISKNANFSRVLDGWHTNSKSGDDNWYLEYFIPVFSREENNKEAVEGFKKIHTLLNKNLSDVHNIDESIKVIEHDYGNGKVSDIGYGIRVSMGKMNNDIYESVETEVEGVSAIKEDGQAVGAMLPVTAPDEVYEKNILTTEAVDNEYDSLKLKKEEKEKTTNQQLDSSKPESKPDAVPKNEASPLAKEYKENAEEIEQLMKECGMKTSYEPVFEEGNEAAIFEDGDEVFTEGGDRHIDDDIKPMIDKLNDKGYKTMASCSGHPSSRSKSDRFRDGVKYGKLYSTARVVFDKIYDFPNVPDGWSKKVMKDDNRVGIYVDPPSFKIINGLPEKQYTNWKRRYMAALEKWVNDLPKEGETKEDDNSDVALESVLNDLTTDALVGQGYGESYTD